MAEPKLDFYYPFDSISGDRKTTAATERRFWSALFSDGVVGSGSFPISDLGSGVYSIGKGIGIVGGGIGGITAPKSITASLQNGGKGYIVLRMSTLPSDRDIKLAFTLSPVTDYTADQVEQGGVADLVLYSVEKLSNGGYALLDERSYCSSFDNAQYKVLFDAMLHNMQTDGAAKVSAIVEQLHTSLDGANAEIAGMYGAAGRQGFNNPCFLVNQRGSESYQLSTGSTFTFDRWKARIGGASTVQPVIIDRVQDGQRTALRIANKAYAAGSTSAASAISQAIENGVRTFAAGGKAFTVSFDAKADNAAKIGIEATQYHEAGGVGAAIKARTVDVTTNWKRFVITFTGTITPDIAKNDALKIAFFFAWRGNSDRFGADQAGENVFYLANMQINEGTRALPCYAKPYAEDLEDCQRYFCAFGLTSLSVGSQQGVNRQYITSPLPLTRRMYGKMTASVTDRTNILGYGSIETAAGAWVNGLNAQISNNSEDNPVFIVLGNSVAAATRVCFNSVSVTAEIPD